MGKMKLNRGDRVLKAIIIFSLGILMMVDMYTACIVQPWESWTPCVGECGTQTQWRIRYFHLDCGNFTDQECIRICNLTDVKGNETRNCINCSEGKWMSYFKKHRSETPCGKDKDLLTKKVALYIAIPMVVAGAVLGACCGYVCFRAKDRRKKRRKFMKDEKILPEMTSNTYHPSKRQIRVNSIDVQAQPWDW